MQIPAWPRALSTSRVHLSPVFQQVPAARSGFLWGHLGHPCREHGAVHPGMLVVGLRKLRNAPAGKAAAAFGDVALQISLISPRGISCSASALFPEVSRVLSGGKP